MNETLWKHKEKVWKPRNKQSAFIVRPANELLLHTPPPEPPKIAPTPQEKQKTELDILRKRIALAEKWKQERSERRAKLRATNPPQQPKPKTFKHMWAAKYLKRMAKSRGLPPPTTEEIHAFRKSQPHFGKAIK